MEVIIGTKWDGKGREGVIGYEQRDKLWNKVNRYLKWIWEGLFGSPLGFELGRKMGEDFWKKRRKNEGSGIKCRGLKILVRPVGVL